MQVSEFEAAPTKSRHPVYDESMLYSTAPEWSTGEVLLASAYRRLILDVSESEVNLDNIDQVPALMPEETGGPEAWSRLLTQRGGIASPLKHGQYSSLASRQLMPLVPSIARIAGVLGKRPRSRWNPSNLLLETIGAGLGRSDGETLVRQLGTALAISPHDDVFARFVEDSLQQGLVGIPPAAAATPPYGSLQLDEARLRAFRANGSASRLCPAERFCKDLPAVLEAKPSLTRRQWTVLVESIFRLGLGMHVLWTCNANVIMWDLLLAVASGAASPTAAEIEASIWEIEGESHSLLELGSDAEHLIERLIERYAYARTGINLLLCRLGDAGVPSLPEVPIGFGSTSGLAAPVALASFLAHVAANRQSIDPGNAGQWLRARLGQLFDEREDLRTLARCDSGYTKNLFEFARHSLGQVKAKYAEQRCYDLAYLLAYVGERKPLSLEPGPAMLIMLVHACCAANPSIPVSLDDFRRRLGEYGLHVPAGELVDGKTGRDLARLGLMVDSPDAAGGRLLVPPF
jgi:hypothetical protein